MLQITPKIEKEIDAMRKGGKILGSVLQELSAQALPGMRIVDLDALAEKLIREAGATPAFLGYKGFPATLCVSVNEEVVHGNGKRERELTGGDVAGLDLGLVFEGMIVDAAVTVGVGKTSKEARRLVQAARDALQRAIEVTHAGVHVGDISVTVQQYVEAQGFGVVRDLVGHGVGKSLHEPPEVPNFGKKGTGPELTSGITIAIEPMITAGDWHVKTLDDGWTVATKDGSLSAHFEHTIMVTDKGCEILTKP
jgi:methionyl aminopeptidase